MNLQNFAPYFGVAEIILAIVLTILVLMQTKGSGLGSFLGGGDSGDNFRTRRGVEQTMHRVTIYTAAVFFIVTLLSFIAWGQAV